MDVNVERVIFGSERETSLRYLLTAGLLSVATGTILPIAATLEVSIPVLDGTNPLVTLLFICLLAALQSYQNSGLPISIALTTSVPLGYFSMIAFSATAVPDVSIVWGIGTALMYGLPLGVIGFLAGSGLRRLTKAS